MTEPIDQVTRQLIEKEAEADAELNRGNAAMSFMGDHIKAYIAGASVWAEKLKQERNKVIDEVLEILKSHIERDHIDCRGNEFSDFDWNMLKKEIKSLAITNSKPKIQDEIKQLMDDLRWCVSELQPFENMEAMGPLESMKLREIIKRHKL